MNGIEIRFDVFCRKVLVNRMISAKNKQSQISKHETRYNDTIKYTSVIYDSYFENKIRFGSEIFVFQNDDLYNILLQMESPFVQIVLYYYGSELNDIEISRKLRMPKSTVHYKRHSAIRYIRERIVVGGEKD